MSWYSTTFLKRMEITVPNVAGDATIDVNVVIPPEWDDLWTNLTAIGDTAGLSLRVVASNGVTLLNYSVDDGAGGAWSTSARTGRIQIDGVAVTATANTVISFWVYYYVTATTASGATATTIASAKTGYIDLGRPGPKSHVMRPLPVGATVPPKSYQKAAGESEDIWVDLSAILERSASAQREKLRHEEPKHMIVTAVDEGGTPTTALYTVTACRWVQQPDGRMYARIRVTAGSSGTNYTIIVTITTCIPNVGDHRVLVERFGLHVQDVQEAA